MAHSFHSFLSPFEVSRALLPLVLPDSIANFPFIYCEDQKICNVREDAIDYFPISKDAYSVALKPDNEAKIRPMSLGVVFSGGPAPGGHNVLLGLSEFIERLPGKSNLYGFLGGFQGILNNKYVHLPVDLLRKWKNSGGFHLLSTGRKKIEKEEFDEIFNVCSGLKLDALIIIGGDDSNTNAGLLAEFFAKNLSSTCIIGVPKTIDGDLQENGLEMSFGFDTASKISSQIVGNLAADALSSRKNYHIVRLMGRHASHITLETALQVQPTWAIISESVRKESVSLDQISAKLAEIIIKRSEMDLNYGVILVPEGLLEHVPEMDSLLCVINDALVREPGHDRNSILSHIDPASSSLLSSLPKEVQEQFLGSRDAHGNVALSQIETERLILYLVKNQLNQYPDIAKKFMPITHFIGYECRCAAPTIFDAHYCYALGICAAALAHNKKNGYMAVVSCLDCPISEWQPGGIPLNSLFRKERRGGEWKPVIKKTTVALDSQPFQFLQKNLPKWAKEDSFCNVGTFFGEEKFNPIKHLPKIFMMGRYDAS